MKHHLKVSLIIMLIITLFCQSYSQTNNTNNTNNDNTYDIANNYTIENDNIEIKFYKSEIPRIDLVSEYQEFIKFKNEFYFENFKKFNNKYLPENLEYKKTILEISIYWYISAGFVGLLFIIYIILRVFFRKFRGAKDDNIHSDDKIFLWILFCKKYI
jgi:hypothetical protein